ncbi:LOW QUALITY PROTEIN: hypothetical protein HID58_001979, partial [Brassica napus]
LQGNGQVPGLILVQESSDGTTGWGYVSSSSDVDTIECRNGKHSISSRSIVLHKVFNNKQEPRDSPLRLIIAYRFCGDLVERMRGISEHESTYLWFMATGKGS